MAINIGRTGTSGRFVGGGAGVYRHTGLKLLIDPYKYECFSPQPTDSGMSDLSGWGNDIYPRNGATNYSNGYWYFDGTNDFAYRFDDSDFDFGTTTDFSIQMWFRNLKTSGDWGLMAKGKHGLLGWSIWFDDTTVPENPNMAMCIGNNENYYDLGTGWESGWQNLAVVLDRSVGITVYKNGVQTTSFSLSSSGTNLSTSYYLIIGGTQGSNSTSTVNDDFYGYMGQILIYTNKLLSADEVRQNFNCHRGIYGV